MNSRNPVVLFLLMIGSLIATSHIVIDYKWLPKDGIHLFCFFLIFFAIASVGNRQ